MKYSWILFFGIFFASCNQSEPRRPINKVTSSKNKLSIEINKQIRAAEEQIIKQYIQKDTLVDYQFSPSGFAYGVLSSSLNTKKEIFKTSVLTFDQTIYNLNNQVLYPKKEMVTRLENSTLITGIREGLKLMKEDEEFKFIFSSFVAHGFRGDNHKIGKNTPIVVKIKLININNK